MDRDEEAADEIEVSIDPRAEALARFGITDEEFSEALLVALEKREELAERDDLTDEDMPFLEEMLLDIGGKSYKLEDLADVEIRSDVP